MADPARFPDGLVPVIDHIHSLGLKFGLYTSVGETTCNPRGHPIGTWPRHGSYGHYKEDTATFASWGVDYVKVDWCGSKEGHSAEELHTNFSEHYFVPPCYFSVFHRLSNQVSPSAECLRVQLLHCMPLRIFRQVVECNWPSDSPGTLSRLHDRSVYLLVFAVANEFLTYSILLLQLQALANCPATSPRSHKAGASRETTKTIGPMEHVEQLKVL